MKPRIAIPVPTTNDAGYNQRSWPSYAEAVSQAGGEPVRIDLGASPEELRRLAAGCDGVLLPGSPADVDPALYGAERDPACAAADPARETVDYLLLEDAERRGKPVVAICYGIQSLNVWSGGTLVQDLMPMPVNHSAGSKIAVAHTARVLPGSLLARLLEPEEAPLVDGWLRLPVNSSHHQAVAAPGVGLRVVARSAEDGVVEAVERVAGNAKNPGDLGEIEGARDAMFHVEHSGERPQRGQFVLGVQWHPERSYSMSAASRAIFARLVEEAQRFAHGSRESQQEPAALDRREVSPGQSTETSSR